MCFNSIKFDKMFNFQFCIRERITEEKALEAIELFKCRVKTLGALKHYIYLKEETELSEVKRVH